MFVILAPEPSGVRIRGGAQGYPEVAQGRRDGSEALVS
jgi:hypothetical protein